jgi:asparagine synthase (glutamine-hydrolysing)
LKRFIDGAAMEGLARHELWTSSIAPPLRERLGASGRAGMAAHATAHAIDWQVCELLDVPTQYKPVLLDLLQRRDLETTLAEGLLTKADRASMQSALELRAPFLDRHVMEFAATLPVRARVSGFETKAFLKRYALRYLPKKIVYRRKRGLSVPLAIWLRGPLEAWARENLASGRLDRIGLSTRAALEIFDEHLSKRADHARALWTLLALAEWIAWAERRGVIWTKSEHPSAESERPSAESERPSAASEYRSPTSEQPSPASTR